MSERFNAEMFFFIEALKHYIIEALKSKGSAEDEIGDGEPKYTKLRPMRVEMYGMNWNR